jgi:hypothetical protein
MEIKKVIIDINDISTDQKSECFRLFKEYYDNTSESNFLNDLNEKDGILLVQDEEDQIIAFSTYKVEKTMVDAKKIHCLFSGDSIVHERYWGQHFVISFVGYLFMTLINKGYENLYWMLISKGYKTYMYLPLIFNEYYPSYRYETPSELKKIMDVFYSQKYGRNYKSANSIIMSDNDYLKPEFNNVNQNKSSNKDILFFQQMNPNHIIGHELTCIAKLSKDNFTEVGMKYIQNL